MQEVVLDRKAGKRINEGKENVDIYVRVPKSFP